LEAVDCLGIQLSLVGEVLVVFLDGVGEGDGDFNGFGLGDAGEREG
jgi:hypothetical protein